MSDDPVGYCKPPRQHRFKKGVCPNPAGRGKRRDFKIGDVTRAMLEEQTVVTSRARRKKLSRLEILIHRHVTSALKGNVGSADALLRLREHAFRYAEAKTITIIVEGGLPDGSTDIE